MDSSATSHIAGPSGNLDKLTPPSLHTPSTITVGDGSVIPVLATGSKTLPPHPFHLNHILLSPRIVQNLISVRCFTRDNWCIVRFDPFGFTVKDMSTGRTLMRSSSSGDLYPFL
ncbi:hypothetical protein VPH35_023120 [Triticum aestivum]